MTVNEKRLLKVREVVESVHTKIEREMKEKHTPWDRASDSCKTDALNTLLGLFRKWDGKKS